MITLLRRIRNKLIDSGSITKYLLYAIGEILLVVMGILIALQLNNWNDRKSQNLNDIDFLINLKGEIILDTLALSDQINWYNELNENIRSTLIIIDTSEALNSEQAKQISKTIAEAEYLLPVKKNLDRNGLLVASGSIKRLNQDLHYNYLRYLELIDFSYDLTIKQANALVSIMNNELYPSVDLNFIDDTKNRIVFDLATLKNNRGTNNALQKSIYYRKAITNLNKPILIRAKSLIQQIDDVLENEVQ